MLQPAAPGGLFDQFLRRLAAARDWTESTDRPGADKASKDRIVGYEEVSGVRHAVLQGSRGGTYYFNSAGNKSYTKDFSESAEEEDEDKVREAKSSEDRIVGYKEVSGVRHKVFEGSRDGTYHIDSAGNKTYFEDFSESAQGEEEEVEEEEAEKSSKVRFNKDIIVGHKVVSGVQRDVFEGPRGGTYYVNSASNKSYTKDFSESATGDKKEVEEEEEEKKPSKVRCNKDRIVGHKVVSGVQRNVFEGPGGGNFYVNSAGNKSYTQDFSGSATGDKKEEVEKSSKVRCNDDIFVGHKVVSGVQRDVFQGPSGGTYYVNSAGNKSYSKEFSRT